MKDIVDELTAVQREVGGDKEGVRSVVLRRTYQAEIADVWDALTTPERITRWFLPVSGDFRVGGRYQLEGNAGGEILACDAPHLLSVTWVFGEPAPFAVSELEVRLSRESADATALELRHTATVDPDLWNQFGPGAVGVGWDLALVGFSLYLASGEAMSTEDKEAFAMSEEAKAYMTGSAQAWGVAHEASGATAEEAATAVVNTTGFYVPTP